MPDGTSTESGPGEGAEVKRHDGTRGTAGTAGVAAMALAALGVVFGDIGTSPLYAFETVFLAHNQDVKPDEASVYGINCRWSHLVHDE